MKDSNLPARFYSQLSALEIDEFAGIWELNIPLIYYSAVLDQTLCVPAGFKTDFASIPRLPMVYLFEGGKGNRAAVVHDWLYSTQRVSREVADAVLKEALVATGYSVVTANLFYAAVRTFGGSHWKQDNVPQVTRVQALMD